MNFRTAFSGVALITLSVALASCTHTPKQGWTEKDRAYWYEATQGSRLMPLAWFNALEQPGADGAMFADPAYLTSFGYLPAREERPNALPTGFAVDRQNDEALPNTGLRWYAGQTGKSAQDAEPWVGFNCAACHTAEIHYAGQKIRVDGGPSLGDYQSFVEAADRALDQTLADAARFNRFAARVLVGKDTPDNRTLLRTAMQKHLQWQKLIDTTNETPLRYGFARVDAFGHIYNKVALLNGAPNQIRNPSDAPVSYPHLWNISKQVRVQWNGVVKNEVIKLPGGPLEYGALGRNVGEVIGVFGDVAVKPASELSGKLDGYESSVQAKDLIELELTLDRLPPPSWPSAFPAIDEAKRKRGDELFDQMCASCHLPQDKWATDGKKTKDQGIERMSTLPAMKASGDLTDIWMACNAATYFARTGKLEGTKQGFISGEPFGPDSLIVTQLSATVKGAMIGKKKDLIEKAIGIFFGVNGRRTPFQADPDSDDPAADLRAAREEFCTNGEAPPEIAPLLAYKARPLDGIWATAPYLHNGSVPTLYHLLLPPAQRPARFWLGSRDYDPQFVGYVWKDRPAGPAFEFRATDDNGAVISGNGNGGHVYGVDKLSDADRWALVEYMKSL